MFQTPGAPEIIPTYTSRRSTRASRTASATTKHDYNSQYTQSSRKKKKKNQAPARVLRLRPHSGPVRKFAKVFRPPAEGVGFKTVKWVPVEELNFEERVEWDAEQRKEKGRVLNEKKKEKEKEAKVEAEAGANSGVKGVKDESNGTGNTINGSDALKKSNDSSAGAGCTDAAPSNVANIPSAEKDGDGDGDVNMEAIKGSDGNNKENSGTIDEKSDPSTSSAAVTSDTSTTAPTVTNDGTSKEPSKSCNESLVITAEHDTCSERPLKKAKVEKSQTDTDKDADKSDPQPQPQPQPKDSGTDADTSVQVPVLEEAPKIS